MYTAVDCGPPPSTANGQVSAPTTILSSVATYQCDSGYEFQSGSLNEAITCQEDGTWSNNSVPTCNGKHTHTCIYMYCVRMGWRIWGCGWQPCSMHVNFILLPHHPHSFNSIMLLISVLILAINVSSLIFSC